MAAQKVNGVLAADGRVKVISPDLTAELRSLVESGVVEHIPRPYQNGDLEGAFLAIAATDDTAVNHAVWAEAHQRDCLVNVVDDPAHSTFILPAVVQRGELNIAISTGGSSPALARRMREKIEKAFGFEYGILTEIMAEIRPEIKTNFPPGKARLEAALRVIDSNVIDIIKNDGKEAALSYAREQLSQQQ